MMASQTGKTRTIPCKLCGLPTVQQEIQAEDPSRTKFWSTQKHRASCGEWCWGGGAHKESMPQYRAKMMHGQPMHECPGPKMTCNFHDAHNRCDKPATHRIEWGDGRHSLGCDDHLEIVSRLPNSPARIVKLEQQK